MSKRHPGATLAIARFGTIVYERGYGWANEDRTEPMRPDAMLRIASVSKPLTVGAVRRLIEDGAFELTDFAFDLGQSEGGLLDLEPFPSLGDPRLAEITIEHLIHHRGGWDRDLVGDHTYREITIANEMGVASPPGRANTVRWILGQPLEHAPGSEYAYSNIGCLVMGLIVEQETGLALDEAIQQLVLDPIGIEDEDHIAGRTFASDHDPREPHYFHNGLVRNVFDPAGARVAAPYGGWDHEARIGQGGQVTTAASLAIYAAHHWVNGSNIGVPKDPDLTGGWRWNHTGALNGTGSLIRQRGDGITYAVIFNTQGFGGTIRNTLDPVLDAINEWPSKPIECCPLDLDDSGAIDLGDLNAVLGAFGENAGGDINGDGWTDLADLNAVLGAFGEGCP